MKEKFEIVKFLLSQGADVNHAEKYGKTALDYVSHNGSSELAQMLLEHGAMMEHVDLKGMRPLDRTISSENLEVVKCFLRKGAKLGPSTWKTVNGKPSVL